MNRTVNLLVCLGILIAGVALESAADDATSTSLKHPCGGKVGTSEVSTCLQTLLYEDETGQFWSALIYQDSLCNDQPIDDYLWTDLGQSGPQYCNGNPGCLHDPAGGGGLCPVIARPLPKGKGYVDILNSVVTYPGLAPDKTWKPKDALTDLGELRTTFVKVKNANGQYFAVRLAAGIAELEKIRFPAGAFPARPRIVNLKILVGFETEFDAAELLKLPEAIPAPWKNYPNCPTAFILNVGNCDYRVISTAANPVKFPAVAPQPPAAKPLGKNAVKPATD